MIKTIRQILEAVYFVILLTATIIYLRLSGHSLEDI